MKPINKQFSKKLLAVFLIMSLLPSIFVAVFSGLVVNRILRGHLIDEAQKVVSSGIYSLDKLMGEYIAAVDDLCAGSAVTELLCQYDARVPGATLELENIVYQSMYKVLRTLDTTSDIHVLHKAYNVTLSLRDTPEVYSLPSNSDWGAFYSANNSYDTIIKPNIYVNSRNITMGATVMKAIRDKNKIVGYVAIDVPLEVMKNVLVGSNQLLPINFTLMSKMNYVIFNDANLPSNASFISWKGRELTGKPGYTIEPMDDYHLLISYSPSEKYNLVLLGAINIDLILGQYSIISSVLLIMAITSLAFFAIVSMIITKRITRPLQTIVTTMHGIENGDFDRRVDLPQNDEFGYLATQFNTMCEKIKELFTKDREKQESLRVAELKNLQAQINPHFLCNTLDSVKWLAKLHEDEQVYDMVRHLCILLKSGISLSNEFLTVNEIVKNLQSYITLQQIRFPDKFNVQIQIDAQAQECLVPNLLLQPIVENAMLHGLEAKTGVGSLIISCRLDGALLHFKVQDDGIGMDEQRLAEIIAALDMKQDDDNAQQHIGLRNIHKRIKLYYGEQYGLVIDSRLNVGTIMTITLPYKDIVKQENE